MAKALSKIIGSQGAALVRSDSTPAAPTIRGAYAAKPVPGRATGTIGVRFNTGAGSAASAIAKGEAQRSAQAEVGQRGLPSAVKAKLLKQINRPFTPPPTPGTIADLESDSRGAAATSTGIAQKSAALVETRAASERIRAIGSKFADAEATANSAAAAAAAASRAGNITGARVNAAKAHNAKVQAASLAKSLLKATADGQRAAATVDAVTKAQRSPTRQNIDNLKKLRDTRANFPIPPEISEAASEETIEGENMLRYQPQMRNWAWGNTGLGSAPVGNDMIAAAASADAAAVRRMRGTTASAIRAMGATMNNITSSSGLAGLLSGFGSYTDSITTLAQEALKADAAKAAAKADARAKEAAAKQAAAEANARAALATATAQDKATAAAATQAAAQAEANRIAAEGGRLKTFALLGTGGFLLLGTIVGGVVAYKKWM